jgi:hypothetical protein
MEPRDDQGLTPAELEAESAEGLPDREAMSTLDPSLGSVPALPTDMLGGAGLLDLDVDVDLTADAAAPVSAAVAANANVAAPIDAAVSANIASPDATSIASAPQQSVIVQDLDGVASADVDQTSDIAQGETQTGGGAPTP